MLFKNYNQLVANGLTPEIQQKRKDVLDILTAAVEAVNPYLAMERVFQGQQFVVDGRSFDVSRFDRVFLVGFGKASVGMAQAVYDAIPTVEGVVITNDTSASSFCDTIEVVVGGHPLPNMGSVRGAEKVLDIVRQCGENDLLIVLISGGGSSLLCKPRIALEALQETTSLLLHSGATINEINTIRKHLSFVKGGQLVKQVKGVVVSLIISDIVGDPLEFIASGPTVADSTTFFDAKKVCKRYHLWDKIPDEVRTVINKGITGETPETLKKDDPVFNRVFHSIVANNSMACAAAVEKANNLGYKGCIVTTSLTGEAREMGRYLVEKAKQSLHNKKTVFIAGGETTVTVTGDGNGGRNQEMVLGSISDIAESDMVLASFATDGIDGGCDAAGAIADGSSFEKAKENGCDPVRFLENNDSYGFFSQLNDGLMTGSTGTNVMDIQVIIL